MKKCSILNMIFVLIGLAILAAIPLFFFIRFVYFLYMITPPKIEKAQDALDRAITSIDSGTEFNDLIITTSIWDNVSEFSEDFTPGYNILWDDCFFGTWDFAVEFPETEKEYHFSVSYSRDTSQWRIYVRPAEGSLVPHFSIRSLLPEYRQVSREFSPPSEGEFLIACQLEADPNIPVDREDIRSRITNALSEDGWQPMPLPDQNSLDRESISVRMLKL